MNGLTVLGLVGLTVILYLLLLELGDARRDHRARRVAADRSRHPAVCSRRIGGAR